LWLERYFFHATHSSKESPEYEAEEDEDGEDTEDEEALNEAGPSKSRSHARESSPHAEWLQSTGEEDEEKSEERVRKINLPDDQESDTEDEAEFEKVDYDAEDEDWMKVDKQGGRDEQAGFARSMVRIHLDILFLKLTSEPTFSPSSRSTVKKLQCVAPCIHNLSPHAEQFSFSRIMRWVTRLPWSMTRRNCSSICKRFLLIL
jgi:hypothetical protein